MITGYRKLTLAENRNLSKFNSLNYEQKDKLKNNNYEKYQYLISLKEQSLENGIIISHNNYRKENLKYNKQIVESINPAFFITLKYIDSVATSNDKVASIFESIKYEIKRIKQYKFIHYIEQGDSGSFHSHIFVSTIKNKQKESQILWLKNQLIEYQKLNKFAIANGEDSIDVQLYDDKELKLKQKLRVSYVNKMVSRNYMSLDIKNSDNLTQ
jgi:hypothetical protein